MTVSNQNIALQFSEFIYSQGQKYSSDSFDLKKVDLSIIWLHGLGATKDDFIPIVAELKLAKSIHYIFPQAPSQAVTVNANMVMPSWYDIYQISEKQINQDQFNQSIKQIQLLIEKQMDLGYDSKQIILIGFSQGGAVAINAGLEFNHQLKAIFALSTYIAKKPDINPINKNCPIYCFHGDYDNVVPIHLARKAKDFFDQSKQPFFLKTYPMMHQVCFEQIKDMAKIIDGLA